MAIKPEVVIEISQQGARATKSAIDGVNQSLRDTKKDTKAATVALTALRKGAAGAAAAIATVGAKKAFDFAKQGASLMALERAYKATGKGAQELNAIMSALGGDVSRRTALSLSNMGHTFGFASRELTKFAQIARAAAIKTGQDVEFLYNSIVTGTARQSKQILDNLGILINSKQSYDAYAKSLGKTAKQLTDVEKKQAFVNEVMRQGNKIISDVPVDQMTQTFASVNRMFESILDTLKKITAISLNYFIEFFTGKYADQTRQSRASFYDPSAQVQRMERERAEIRERVRARRRTAGAGTTDRDVDNALHLSNAAEAKRYKKLTQEIASANRDIHNAAIAARKKEEAAMIKALKEEEARIAKITKQKVAIRSRGQAATTTPKNTMLDWLESEGLTGATRSEAMQQLVSSIGGDDGIGVYDDQREGGIFSSMFDGLRSFGDEFAYQMSDGPIAQGFQAFSERAEEMRKKDKAIYDFATSFEGLGRSMGQAAFSAVAFGGSVKKAINQAAIGAFYTALLDLGMLAFKIPLAMAFAPAQVPVLTKAAGAAAAQLAVAGGIAGATGGLTMGGASSGGGGGGAGAATGGGYNDRSFERRNAREDDNRETVLNVNFVADGSQGARSNAYDVAIGIQDAFRIAGLPMGAA